MSNLISILMPVKNAEPFLEECLESILEQDEAHWELIAVNDHSTDNSLATLNSFAKQDERIKVMSCDEKGVIPALRLAYENSIGALIHRMDADDLMPKKKLSSLKHAILASPKGSVASGKVYYFSKEGLNEGYRNYERWLNQLCTKKNQWEEIYKECVIASPNWMIRRSDLEQVNAFRVNRYPEDYDLVFRFYEANYKVVCLDKITHHWRDHKARSSRNMEVYKHNDYFELKWFYFKKLDYRSDRPLMIWGAGPKGKKLARTINEDGTSFNWVSNNPNKHGKEIYNKILASFESILHQDQPQILIAVGNKEAQKKIRLFLNQHDYSEGKDYFFFC